MSVFVRRFLSDPGAEVLLNIESVNILDLDPPASITGIGTGVVLLVAEMEDGPYNEPTEVNSATDLSAIFGGLGYTYDSVGANYPCAVERNADGAGPELWNGNGIVALNGKTFAKLLLCRVDSSVGEVTFSRIPSLSGATVFKFDLEPGQALVFEDGTGPDTATFTAAAATVASGAGTYPSGFVGGETLTLGYDTQPNFTVTFLSTDQTKLQVISRINQYAGFAYASDGGTTVMNLTGKTRGLSGQVRVISGSAGVLTALGLTATTVLGTGNVSDIDAVTVQEVDAVVNAATAGTIRARIDEAGALRVENATGAGTGTFRIVSNTAPGLGLPTQVSSTANSNAAVLIASAGTYPTTFAGGETITMGQGSDADFVVTFLVGDQSIAQVISRINAAAGYEMVTQFSATRLMLTAKDGQALRILAASTGVFAKLGLAIQTVTPRANVTGKIPAGTRVRVPNGTRYVTTQSVAVTPGKATPYAARIRPAVDDGTATGTGAGTVTQLEVAPLSDSFTCINLLPVSAALTESALDVKYADALDSTIDVSSVAKLTNIVYSARQSRAIRAKLRENALTASALGCYGRVACVRPPLGTSKAAAKSTAAAPGVGATRSDRVIYNYPGARTIVPAIALRGLSGGKGFTADGAIDVGSDGFMASILSQLPPEENPGQETPYTGGAISLESSAAAKGLTMKDYTDFKAAGIAAPRFDNGAMIFQSGCTSVDPVLQPNRKNIARRRMADFIQDSVAARAKAFGKKLNRPSYRNSFVTEVDVFLLGLLSPTNPNSQRIDGYMLDKKSANTPKTLAQGRFRLIMKARTLSSLDSIELATEIGEGVTFEDTAALVNPG